MRVITTIPQHDLRAVPDAARAVEAAGYDGIVTLENKHDAFLPLAVAATCTERVELATGIAISFARSPMSAANVAWDLNEASRGRFVLGLGSLLVLSLYCWRTAGRALRVLPWAITVVLALAAVVDWFQASALAFYTPPGINIRLIKAAHATPDKAAADMFPRAARANRYAFYNQNGEERTVKDLYTKLISIYGPGKAKFAETRTAATTETPETSSSVVIRWPPSRGGCPYPVLDRRRGGPGCGRR